MSVHTQDLLRHSSVPAHNPDEMIRKLTVHVRHGDPGHVTRCAMIGTTRARRSRFRSGCDLIVAKMAGKAPGVIGGGVSLQGSVWIMTGHAGKASISCFAPTPALFEAIGLKANHGDAALRDS